MRLSDAVSDAVARGSSSGSYMGTVTAIDTVGFALTVDIGTGTLLTGVRWITSYAPAVADFVVVLRVGSGWWVMGKNSKNLTAGGQPVQGELALSATSSWAGTLDGAWSWSPAQPDTGLPQGKAGWGGVFAGVSAYPPLSSVLPSGATVTGGKVRVRRLQPGGGGSGGGALVAPVFRGHTYTGQPVGAPAWTTTTWTPGAIAVGQEGQWDLPSAWLTALLASTMSGIGVTAATPAALSFWQPPIISVTYTTPT